jgi:hypothetical protein
MSAILDYLTSPDDPESLAQAVETLVQRRGARRLQAALADELTCADCQARLAEYARVGDLATPLSSELQAVAQHLAHCEVCSADYAALLALSRAGEADDLAETPVPEPDLSFLPSAGPTRAGFGWRWDDLGRLIVQFSQELLRAFAPPQALQPSFVTKDAIEETALVRFSLGEDTLEDLSVTLTAYADADDPDLCRITAEVSLAGRQWPDLAETEIVLIVGDQVQTKTTDEWGKVLFKGVRRADLPRVRFQITPVR